MEFVQDFFFTASLALLFSFIVTKLVSMAMAGDALRNSELESSGNVDSREMQFEERGVEFLGEEEFVDRVDEFVGGSILVEPESGIVRADGSDDEEEVVVDCGLKGGTDNDSVEGVASLKLESGAIEFSKESVKVAENAVESEFGGLKDQNRGLDCSLTEKTEETPVNDETGLDCPINNPLVQQSGVAETEMQGKDHASGGEEEDGWEGIERTELEKLFDSAAKIIEGEGKDYLLANVNSDVQMRLYGLHKIATEGPCYVPQPMALKVSARAKWNAWQKLANMSPEEAMEQYVTLLSENVPGWMGDKPCGDSSNVMLGGAANPNLSTFLHHLQHSTNESERGDKDGGSVNKDKE